MKQSIVWKCAIAIAFAQVLNFVVLSGLAVNSELGPVYREWLSYTSDTLRGHHQVLADGVRKDGVQSAQTVAEQLSLNDFEHAVIVTGPGWLAEEYMGLPGSEWNDLAELAEEPRRYRGQIRWISEAKSQDTGQRDRAIILSSARWPVDRAARNHPIGSAIWILGGLLLSAVVGGTVATWFTKPILQLRTSINRFASGELESRPDARLQARGDEIGQLAREMADMESRIASLVNAQKELLDHVAHELRSPLARINVAVELEEQRAQAGLTDHSAQQPNYLTKIRRESDRLSSIVDQLLELSALEHRIDSISKSEISLTRIVREVAEACAFEAEAQGRSIVLDADQDLQMNGHGELIRSAIENIVRNAIRFTPSGTAVQIQAHSSTGSRARGQIVVRDRGPGVPEGDIQLLFQPFSRIGSQHSSDGGGFGLGLALADRSVRAHKGTMTARNCPGGGFEICIDLPILESSSGR